jgi:hypothetical protein
MDIQARKQNLLTELKALGLAKVVIEYSGGGDSGQVDVIAAFKPGESSDNVYKGHDVDELAKEYIPDEIPIRVSNVLLGGTDEPLSKRLEQFAYDALDAAAVSDWCNNDGGGGTMTIAVAEGQTNSEDDDIDVDVISIRHYYNVNEQVYESATL